MLYQAVMAELVVKSIKFKFWLLIDRSSRLRPRCTCEQEPWGSPMPFCTTLRYAHACRTLFVGPSLHCDWSIPNGAELSGLVYSSKCGIESRCWPMCLWARYYICFSPPGGINGYMRGRGCYCVWTWLLSAWQLRAVYIVLLKELRKIEEY